MDCRDVALVAITRHNQTMGRTRMRAVHMGPPMELGRLGDGSASERGRQRRLPLLIGALLMVTSPLGAACASGGVGGTPDAWTNPASQDATMPTPDANPDSTIRPPDGSSGCTGAPDCDDGLACNGAEQCELGRCVPGTPPVCDDGVSCTRDQCTESGGTATCSYTPDNALCGAGQTCDPTSGCSAACTESPCRLVSPQCGCAAGQACYMAGMSRACTTEGTAAVGTTCAGAGGCVAGAACLGVSADPATSLTQCYPHCDTDADCSAGSLCNAVNDSATMMAIPGVGVCSSNCDLRSNSGCATGARCHVFREEAGAMRWHTDCIGPQGTGGQGASCTNVLDCQPGFLCTGTAGATRCLRWCSNVGSTIGCGSLEICYGFGTPISIRGTTYGVCDSI